MNGNKQKKIIKRILFVCLFVCCAAFINKQYHFVGIVLTKYLNWHSSYVKQENQKHSYDFPSENNGWRKFGATPVYGNEETHSVFDPFVYEEDGKFIMAVSERKNHSLVRIESYNGIDWEKTTTLLERIPNTWEHLVNRASIVKTDSIYHMWYTGQSPDISRIGHATSLDGYVFQRDSINPVLEATLPTEGVSVMNPCVLYNRDKCCFQMWYAAGENYEPDVLFFAESKDGQNWIKKNDPVLTKFPLHVWEQSKVGGCDVKQLLDGSYIMYYIGYQNVDVARICYACSYDGIHWNRSENNLIISPSANSWDSDATYKPSVICRNDTTFLWYNGRSASDEYIGLAIKPSSYNE